MSSSQRTFDPIGIVLDWLDACREQRLTDLLEIYDDQAHLGCCDGGRYDGQSELLRYWTPKLQNATAGAFVLDGIQPEGRRVRLHYRDDDGRAVRTEFWFNDVGRTVQTICVPRGKMARYQWPRSPWPVSC
jgi:hypothetical protein